jgi:hypothetical protein
MGKSDAAASKPAAKKGPSTLNKETNAGKIMYAIASQYALGKDKPDKKIVQGIAGIADRKIFNTVCATMQNKQGWIVYDKTCVEFTDEGRSLVPEDALEVPTNNDALHDKIKASLKQKGSRVIFDFLADGNWRSKNEIAEHLGKDPTNRSFGTYLSGICKCSEKVNEKYRLKDECFLVGRPCDKKDEEE